MSARLVFGVFIAAIALISAAEALPQSRVFGGANANIGQFPHQVSLQREDGTHICGGCILSERTILTAAHCVVVGNGIAPYPPQYLKVRVGSIQRTAGGQLLPLKRIIVNKSYADLLNDVALLELEAPLTFTNNIKAIPLATEAVPAGGEVVVSGWGLLNAGAQHPHRLQWNTFSALGTEACGKAMGFGADVMICLAHDQGNGICNGDAGGPATYGGKLVGVASLFVGGCGSANPDAYVSVLSQRQWIEENIV